MSKKESNSIDLYVSQVRDIPLVGQLFSSNLFVLIFHRRNVINRWSHYQLHFPLGVHLRGQSMLNSTQLYGLTLAVALRRDRTKNILHHPSRLTGTLKSNSCDQKLLTISKFLMIPSIRALSSTKCALGLSIPLNLNVWGAWSNLECVIMWDKSIIYIAVLDISISLPYNTAICYIWYPHIIIQVFMSATHTRFEHSLGTIPALKY